MHIHHEADIHVATYLLATGFKLIGLEQVSPRRFNFQFADPTNNAVDAMRAYFGGAQAEARALLEAFRTLKDRLYQEKSPAGENRNVRDAHFANR